MENQYVELVNNNLIITNLDNFAMPFIRYKVGDMAKSISDKPCSCGRNSLRIMHLMGRDNENIVLDNRKVINGEFFEFLFFGYKSVEKFQVVYYKKSSKLQIRLKIRGKSENLDEIVKKEIYNKFKFQNVEIIETDNFDKTPTGKFKFVFSVDE
jgi:phenylacetate-CoA ligase